MKRKQQQTVQQKKPPAPPLIQPPYHRITPQGPDIPWFDGETFKLNLRRDRYTRQYLPGETAEAYPANTIVQVRQVEPGLRLRYFTSPMESHPFAVEIDIDDPTNSRHAAWLVRFERYIESLRRTHRPFQAFYALDK